MGQQYSFEEKKRAIQLFQILGHYTWVIAELGYPSRTMLHYWIKEYRRTGKIEVTNKTRRKYTVEQRKHAVEYYLSHGRSIKNTIKTVFHFFFNSLDRNIVRECFQCHDNEPEYAKA